MYELLLHSLIFFLAPLGRSWPQSANWGSGICLPPPGYSSEFRVNLALPFQVPCTLNSHSLGKQLRKASENKPLRFCPNHTSFRACGVCGIWRHLQSVQECDLTSGPCQLTSSLTHPTLPVICSWALHHVLPLEQTLRPPHKGLLEWMRALSPMDATVIMTMGLMETQWEGLLGTLHKPRH